MTTRTAAARKLYNEYRDSAGLYDYTPSRVHGFVARVRNLASKTSRMQVGGDDAQAMMFLDIVALRCGFQISRWLED